MHAHPEAHAYPPLVDGVFKVDGSPLGHANFTLSQQVSSSMSSKSNLVRKGSRPPRSRKLDIFNASHNVLSILDPSLPMDFAANSPLTQALQVQYHDLGLNVIGVQEGRRPQFAKNGSHYHMIGAGAEAGQFGCELWFSIVIPYYTTRTVQRFFDRSHFFVVHASPRLLVVQANAPGHQGRYISAHAPTSHHLHERESFFKLLSRFVSVSCFLALNIDANARLNILDDPSAVSPALKRVVDAAQQFSDFLVDIT